MQEGLHAYNTLTHLNRDKIETNLSVPGFRGHQECTLIDNFEMIPHLIPSFYRFLGKCESSLGNFLGEYWQFPADQPLQIFKIFSSYQIE